MYCSFRNNARRKKSIVTGVSSPYASAGDTRPEVVLGGQWSSNDSVGMEGRGGRTKKEWLNKSSNDQVMQGMIGVLTEGTWTRDVRTGSSLGLSKFQILADFSQNLALFIAVFELIHEEKKTDCHRS